MNEEYNLTHLSHHGIKGQRWGIRRFQNPDGTLTAEGKKRKAKYDSANAFQESKRKYNQALKEDTNDAIGIGRDAINIGREGLRIYDRISDKKQPSLDLSNMTDRELQQRINRLNMEQQYARLVGSNQTNRGREAVEDILSIGGSALTITGSALSIALAIMKLKGMS